MFLIDSSKLGIGGFIRKRGKKIFMFVIVVQKMYKSVRADCLISQIHFIFIFPYKIFPKKIIRYFE
jgi:hypothetical protein